jgi:hypothetical protein
VMVGDDAEMADKELAGGEGAALEMVREDLACQRMMLKAACQVVVIGETAHEEVGAAGEHPQGMLLVLPSMRCRTLERFEDVE